MRSASNASNAAASRANTLGPSPSGRTQLDARAELFAGADAAGRTSTASSSSRRFDGAVDTDHMDSRQVMDHALMQHRDTTASARRALQVCFFFSLGSHRRIARARLRARAIAMRVGLS